ncbi:MAG: TaqI-like C-terminal specificity domain-containing protein [Clostridia bacterium]|nr:TaqI-like C-terminal specificity domain-containing protein [Clostridia bacterium]
MEDVKVYTDKLKNVLIRDGIDEYNDIVDFIIIISFLKFIEFNNIIRIDYSSFRFENLYNDYPEIENVMVLIIHMLEDKKSYPSSDCCKKMISFKIPKDTCKRKDFLSCIYQTLNTRQRRELGQYFTPPWLVKYMLDNAFTIYSIDSDRLTNYKVLDPGCGTGNFVIYYIEKALKTISPYDNKQLRNILANTYGFDVDRKALYIAALSLYVLLKQNNYDIELSHLRLVNIDSLKKDKYKRGNIYTIFDRKIDCYKFDMIIGNPPYIENRNINRFYDKNYLIRNYKYAVGRFDIYSIFIERSMDFLTSRGVISYLVPTTLLYNNNFILIRKYILSRFNINLLVNFGNLIFKDVDISMSVLMIQNTDNPDMQNNILSLDASHTTEHQSIQDSDYNIIPQKYFAYNIDSIFDIYSDEYIHKLKMRIIEVKTEYIKDICKVIAGIATGNVKKKIVKTNDYGYDFRKVLEGSDIGRYFYMWNGKYINMDKNIIDKNKGEYATYMREEFIYNPKILIRQTADRIIAAFDEQGYALLNTLYSLLVVDDRYSVKYILALLNSKLLSFFYRSIVRETGKLFPQLKIYHIQNCPIVYSDRQIQRDICEVVEQIEGLAQQIATPCLGKRLKEGHIADVLRKIKQDKLRSTKHYYVLNERVDGMIYDVYKLNDKHISIIENESIQQGLNNNRVCNYLKRIEYIEIAYWLERVCLYILEREKQPLTEQKIKMMLEQKLKAQFGQRYKETIRVVEKVLNRPLFYDTKKFNWIKYCLGRETSRIRRLHIKGQLYFKSK